MSTETASPVRARRRLLLAGAVVLVAVVALVLAVALARRPPPAPSSTDQDVVVTKVLPPAGTSEYTVTEVEAVTRGDDALVRVTLSWTLDPDDSSDTRTLPLLGAEVSHHAPYAGVTADCGLREQQTVPGDATTAVLELPCTGVLVPESVEAVALND